MYGINMQKGLENQKRAVISGHWPLYRYNPALADEGKNPLVIDSKDPTISFDDFATKENRWKQLQKSNPEAAKALSEGASEHIKRKWSYLNQLAGLDFSKK